MVCLFLASPADQARLGSPGAASGDSREFWNAGCIRLEGRIRVILFQAY
jgi:hypothetical protein